MKIQISVNRPAAFLRGINANDSRVQIDINPEEHSFLVRRHISKRLRDTGAVPLLEGNFPDPRPEAVMDALIPAVEADPDTEAAHQAFGTGDDAFAACKTPFELAEKTIPGRLRSEEWGFFCHRTTPDGLYANDELAKEFGDEPGFPKATARYRKLLDALWTNDASLADALAVIEHPFSSPSHVSVAQERLSTILALAADPKTLPDTIRFLPGIFIRDEVSLNYWETNHPRHRERLAVIGIHDIRKDSFLSHSVAFSPVLDPKALPQVLQFREGEGQAGHYELASPWIVPRSLADSSLLQTIEDTIHALFAQQDVNLSEAMEFLSENPKYLRLLAPDFDESSGRLPFSEQTPEEWRNAIAHSLLGKKGATARKAFFEEIERRCALRAAGFNEESSIALMRKQGRPEGFDINSFLLGDEEECSRNYAEIPDEIFEEFDRLAAALPEGKETRLACILSKDKITYWTLVAKWKHGRIPVLGRVSRASLND